MERVVRSRHTEWRTRSLSAQSIVTSLLITFAATGLAVTLPTLSQWRMARTFGAGLPRLSIAAQWSMAPRSAQTVISSLAAMRAATASTRTFACACSAQSTDTPDPTVVVPLS